MDTHITITFDSSHLILMVVIKASIAPVRIHFPEGPKLVDGLKVKTVPILPQCAFPTH